MVDEAVHAAAVLGQIGAQFGDDYRPLACSAAGGVPVVLAYANLTSFTQGPKAV